ncbi:MAG: hypothetical protein EPN39_00025 [Chitinophagaceae bacterium]|jgi:peptidoglycan/xylan/chitin deacetylase (PgdA/CDA1 family)|nr:MAG: hypothetical protein EPN39_00025 [Chitinophagaceae bacterium]
MRKVDSFKYKTKRILRRIIHKSTSPHGVILMYHRIGSHVTDPWEIFVNEENFRQQVAYLKKSFNVCSFSSLEETLQQKRGKKKNIFITFDDGCLDNFETAMPILRKYSLPATFFIPTVIFGSQSIFWWEILDLFFWRNEGLPETIQLEYSKGKFIRTLTPDMQKRNEIIENRWSANREDAPNSRCRLYLEICDWIRVQRPEDQRVITEQLLELNGEVLHENKFFKKMSVEQILFLSNNYFEIGAHTIHHPALKFHDHALQLKEINDSISILENILKKPVHSFAYPHGEYNEDTLSIIKGTGIKYACTTDWGAIYPDANPGILPRILVRNMNVSYLKQQLHYLFKP